MNNHFRIAICTLLIAATSTVALARNKYLGASVVCSNYQKNTRFEFAMERETELTFRRDRQYILSETGVKSIQRPNSDQWVPLIQFSVKDNDVNSKLVLPNNLNISWQNSEVSSAKSGTLTIDYSSEGDVNASLAIKGGEALPLHCEDIWPCGPTDEEGNLIYGCR